MSAWLIERSHIDYMIACGLHYAPDGFLPFGDKTVLTPDTRDTVGRLLFAENIMSLRAGYDERADEYWGEHFHLADDYTYQSPIRAFGLPTLGKAVDCYAYQSCEHKGWDQSAAKSFCDVLEGIVKNKRHDTLEHSLEYVAAPWGIKDY